MSTPATPEDDLLAAEYVTGLADLEARNAAEARIRRDPGFAALVARWEERLAPLQEDYPETPAPPLLPQIEARIFGKPARPRWRLSWLAGGAVAAASLALAVMVAQPDRPTPRPTLTATLADADQPLVLNATYDAAEGVLELRRTGGPAAPDGQDYQLWLIGVDGVPVSLGLLRDEVLRTGAEGLAPGVLLAVSLEPLGGSPEAVPTGPVLVSGVVESG